MFHSQGLRPTIPKHTHTKLSELLQKCWQQDPALRPDFSEILETLQRIAEEVCVVWRLNVSYILALTNGSLCCCLSILQVGDEHEGKHKDKILGGFFSALRGRGHWDAVEMYMVSVHFEGSELQPSPVPSTPAPSTKKYRPAAGC